MEIYENYNSNIKKVLLILSGKGGVGKSSVTTQLAYSLYEKGFKVLQVFSFLHFNIFNLFKKVGVLDVDLCGPSIPKMFNLDKGVIHQSEDGWIPAYVDKEQRLGIMSIGFLLTSDTDAVIWRGPKKNCNFNTSFLNLNHCFI
jgi:Mrp family chromosome partitioning ATPase